MPPPIDIWNYSSRRMSKIVSYVDFIERLDNNSYKIEGYLGGRRTEVKNDNLTLTLNGEKCKITFVQRKNTHDGIEYNRPIKDGAFEATIQLADKFRHINVEFRYAGKLLKIKANRFTGLSQLAASYRVDGDIMWLSFMGRLRIARYHRLRHVAQELLIYGAILINWRLSDALVRVEFSRGIKTIIKSVGIVGEAIVTIPTALAVRTVHHLMAYKPGHRRVWIISDRPTVAGDNGEALFRYIIDNNYDTDIDCYFAISKRSSDYARLNSMGRVLDYGSMRYKMMFLRASLIISSQADIETTNPFGRQVNRYVDLFRFKFVFLQHGIIRHDLSDWLNRFNRNIDLFVTSARTEYESIIDGGYGYSPRQVVLSGLPRYDLLQNNPKNKLILAPTYRAHLLRSGTDRLGERPYDDSFKHTKYAVFYDTFMNDQRLIDCMRKHNVTGELYLHPVFKNQIRDFTPNEVFDIADFPYNYAQVFEEGNLLVSDHSSVMFDFAYLKKPVVYAHFDADEFYATHTYTKSDFFSDKEQGFGPVCTDYESLIEQTISMIEGGMRMSKEYRHRVDAFFEYNDKSNSKRVLDAIFRIETAEDTQ